MTRRQAVIDGILCAFLYVAVLFAFGLFLVLATGN